MDQYVEFDRIEEQVDIGDKLVAKITRRQGRHTDQFSFRIVRKFDLDGMTRETSWFDHRHFERIPAIIEQVKDRMQKERKRVA